MSNLLNKSKKHFLKLIFAVLCLLVFLKWAEVEDYSFIYKAFYSNEFWIGCFLLILVQFVKALRFQILVSEYDVQVNFTKNLIIHCIVPILGLLTPSKLGEGMKLVLIKDKKEKVGFCFLLEKLMDMLILFCLGAIGLYFYAIFINSIYFIIPIVIVGIICLIYFDKIFNFLFQKLSPNKLEKNWFQNNLKNFLKPKHFLTILLGIFVWLLNIYAAYYFAFVAGGGFINISFFEFAPLFASAIIVGLISGFPGGIGSREATITFLFLQVFQIDVATGGVFSILNLFGNYLTFAVIGLISYLIFKMIYKQELA